MSGTDLGLGRGSARIALALLLVCFAPATSRAIDISAETLYRDGLSAKAAGDLATAARDFEAALKIEPNNVDTLLQLGLVYGFERRFAEARRVLERAASLAPADFDVRLGLARIKSYAGDFAGAEADMKTALAQQPDNVEALALAGRIAFYRQELTTAKQRFEAALARAPDDPDALMGLGDVLAAEGDEAGAHELYLRAERQAPGSKELAERLARPVHKTHRWRLDMTVSYSHLSRQPQKDWKETFDQLSYRLSDATTVHGRLEESERFGRYDTYLEGGVDHRFLDWLSGYLYVGGAPVDHFRERITGITGGTVRLTRGGETVGATVVTLDTKFSAYRPSDVETVKPGLQQYFLSGRLWTTTQSITTRDENGRFLQGWLGRVNVMATKRLEVYIGLAEAPETSDNVTAETRSQFAGAILDLTEDLAVRLDYLREDRQRSYLRQAATLGLSIKF